MKRVILPALILVLLLIVLLPKKGYFAGDEPVIDLTALKWQVLSPGVAKTDLGGDLPEVVILKLSNDQFKKIYPGTNAARDYFNSQNIFKRKLINVIFCDVTPSKSNADWILIVPHTLHSTASITAWQLPTKTSD